MATKDNLAAAFAGESQANRKYLMFAEQAEKDGYKGAAKLFRAAAEAEQIHAFAEFRANGGVGKRSRSRGQQDRGPRLPLRQRGRESSRAALQRGPRRHRRRRRLLPLPLLRLHPQGRDRGSLPHLRSESFELQEVLVSNRYKHKVPKAGARQSARSGFTLFRRLAPPS